MIPQVRCFSMSMLRLNKALATPSSLFDKVLEAATLDQKQVTPKVLSLEKRIANLPKFTTGNLKTSPKKLNLLARLIQNMTLDQAYSQMNMNLKRHGVRVCAMIVRIKKALLHNYQISPKSVYIKRAFIGKGQYLKRIRIHGRGRMGRMLRRTAHMRIELAHYQENVTKAQKDLAQVAKVLRRTNLHLSLREHLPILRSEQPWSRKPWKYLTSPRWTNPDNAYPLKMRKALSAQ